MQLQFYSDTLYRILNGENNGKGGPDEIYFIQCWKEAVVVYENQVDNLYTIYKNINNGNNCLVLDAINFNNVEVAHTVLSAFSMEINNHVCRSTLLEKVDMPKLDVDIIHLLLQAYNQDVELHVEIWKSLYQSKYKKFKRYVQEVPVHVSKITFDIYKKFITSLKSIIEGSTYIDVRNSLHFQHILKVGCIIDKSENDIKEWMNEKILEEAEQLNMQFCDTYTENIESKLLLNNLLSDVPHLIEYQEKNNVKIWTKNDIKTKVEIHHHDKFKNDLVDVVPFSMDELFDDALYTDKVDILVIVQECTKDVDKECTKQVNKVDIIATLICEDYTANNTENNTDHGICILSGLAVSNTLRNKGHGKIILATWLLMQKRRGKKWCILNAVPMAQNFYARFGFEQIKCVKGFQHEGILNGNGYNFALNLSTLDENSLLLLMIHDVTIPMGICRKRPYINKDNIHHNNNNNIQQCVSYIERCLAHFPIARLRNLVEQIIAPTKHNQGLFENANDMVKILKENFHISMLN